MMMTQLFLYIKILDKDREADRGLTSQTLDMECMEVNWALHIIYVLIISIHEFGGYASFYFTMKIP